ncbi:MAG TPA: hypothetical protein VFW73_01310 [Lacipirellulaceae bacterium]|nr:hypothetical protein [Lacipirellulaceae bacterium]
MNWDPSGNGGLGSGTVTFFGMSPGTPTSRSVTLNIPMRNEAGKPEWLQEPVFFNAFGLQDYDGEATTSGQYRVFVDDVSYTVAAPPAKTSAWGLPGTGLWTVSRNWAPGEVPYGDDRTAMFGSGIAQSSTILLDRDVTVKSLQFDNATYCYALAGTGNLNLKSSAGHASINVLHGAHQIQANVELQSTTDVSTSAASSLDFDGVVAFGGHTLNIAASSNVRFQNVLDDATGGIVNNAGMLSGGGRINANLNNQSGGVVSPGDGLGTLRIDGAFTQDDSSSLAVELGGYTAGQFDVLAVTGAATLSGTLTVSFVNGFSPTVGDSFTVLTTTAGIVDNGLLLGGASAGSFYFNIVGDGLVLHAGLLGDYNQNGIVDAADYVIWRKTLGSTSDLQADGNGNHLVDASDYDQWRVNFGRTLTGGSSASSIVAVPEPSIAILLLIVALAAACARGHLRRTRRASWQFALCRIQILLVPLMIIAACRIADADLIGNSFFVDPQWQGNDNILPQGDPNKKRDDFNNYGYSPDTSNAFGWPGEIGGYFGMNTFDSYYADTNLGGSLGGSFPLKQPLHVSGKLMVNSDHSPTWNMNIGFFNANNYSSLMTGLQESGDGDAVRIAIIEQSPDFRLRLEIRQHGNGYNSPLLAGATGLLDGMYTWSMDYDPTGGAGGNGRLSLNMRGPTTISTYIDVDAAGKNIPMNLNAFGFTDYNSGVSRPNTNKHYTFLDDLTYTTNESADATERWAGSSYGNWTDAPSWQSTSRADGAGFVPNGNNREAIFGTGIDQNALVSVDRPVTVRQIRFDNPSHSYAIVGTGNLTLDHDASGTAEIDVAAGQHQFESKLTLASDASIVAAEGTRLDFNNAFDLAGHSLTITGPGQVNINNSLITGGTGMVLNAGNLSGTGEILGNLTSTGTLAAALDAAVLRGGLKVDGDADLSGTVEVLGDCRTESSIVVLTANRITDHGLHLALDDSHFFQLVVSPTQVIVERIVPEPACIPLVLTLLIICGSTTRVTNASHSGNTRRQTSS